MAMRRYRCTNEDCTEHPHRNEFDFEAEAPVCPKCGIDGREPMYKDVIVPLVLMHFELPSKVKKRGMGQIACAPGKLPIQHDYRFTRAPSVVSCKACKETAAFKEAMTADAHDPKYDAPVVGQKLMKQG